ncbi:MAG: hypothetical protein JXB88_15940 [Spirochaetales bacterium]|nr:hypothetical protein [Spirochaetales bacterium]
MKENHFFSVLVFLIPGLFLCINSFGFDVNFTINIDQENEPISPYIYGTNQLLTDTENWTVQRIGGNRTTGYNWETNASNAGEDWHNSSDNYLCEALGVPESMYETPGAVMTVAHDADLAKARATNPLTIITQEQNFLSLNIVMAAKIMFPAVSRPQMCWVFSGNMAYTLPITGRSMIPPIIPVQHSKYTETMTGTTAPMAIQRQRQRRTMYRTVRCMLHSPAGTSLNFTLSLSIKTTTSP